MNGAEIAGHFEEANAEAVDYVRGPATAHWGEVTSAEGWPVGVTARHIALGHELVLGWVEALRVGQDIAVGDIDAVNAEHAGRGVVADPEEVAALLVENGRRVSEALRSLSEAELSGLVRFGDRDLPAAMVAEAPVRHVRTHLDSIRAVAEADGAGG